MQRQLYIDEAHTVLDKFLFAVFFYLNAINNIFQVCSRYVVIFNQGTFT